MNDSRSRRRLFASSRRRLSLERFESRRLLDGSGMLETTPVDDSLVVPQPTTMRSVVLQLQANGDFTFNADSMNFSTRNGANNVVATESLSFDSADGTAKLTTSTAGLGAIAGGGYLGLSSDDAGTRTVVEESLKFTIQKGSTAADADVVASLLAGGLGEAIGSQAIRQPSDERGLEQRDVVRVFAPTVNVTASASMIDVSRAFYAYENSGRPLTAADVGNLASASSIEPAVTFVSRPHMAMEAEPRRGVIHAFESSTGPTREVALRNATPSSIDPVGQFSALPMSIVERVLRSDAAVTIDPFDEIAEGLLASTTSEAKPAEASPLERWSSFAMQAGLWLPHGAVIVVVSATALAFSPRSEETLLVAPDRRWLGSRSNKRR